MKKYASLICLVCLCLITGCSASQTNLSLMSFNLRYGTASDGPNHWDLRKDMVFSVFQEQAPDVVGVQEALDFQLKAITETVPGYAILGVGRDDGKTKGEYSAVLYKTDRFDVVDSNTFWLSETPEVVASMSWNTACTRICTWALLKDKATNQSFYLYNLHLDHRSQEARVKGVQVVLDRIAKRSPKAPAFITGDFNAGETNPAITQIKNKTFPVKSTTSTVKSVHFVDTYRVIHPDTKDVGTFNGFKGTATGDKIDYIFAMTPVSIDSADILRVNTDGRYPSDHFPVIAKVKLP